MGPTALGGRLGIPWGLLRRRDVADDLTQEVFCRAWQARDRYREHGLSRAYLCIADHLAVDHHRKSRREVNLGDEAWKQIEPVEHAPGVDDALQRHEIFGQLAATLDQLSPQQRRVLLLRFYGELSFAEIAEMMECPLNTVLSYCHRGLHTLRSLLVETAMTDELRGLQRRMEQATTPRLPGRNRLEPETASLRAGWLALEELLVAAESQVEPPTCSVPFVPVPRRRRWTLTRFAALWRRRCWSL